VFRGRSGSLIKILWHDGIGISPLGGVDPGTVQRINRPFFEGASVGGV
jgi:hypothetical protein